jgi:hypothetical protein
MAHATHSPLRLGAAAFAVAVSGLCHGGSIVIEAEAAADVEAPAVTVRFAAPPAGEKAVAGASGDAYLAIPQGGGNPPAVTTGKATYSVTVPAAGNYTLWVRAYWDDSCGNSVGVLINDTAAFMLEDSTYKTWHWVRSPPRLPQLSLAAGTATLVLHNREDGVRIDQILLTTDRRYVPVDVETATTP